MAAAYQARAHDFILDLVDSRGRKFVQFDGGETVIAIAHRLSTIVARDRLVIMDPGKIVEKGTHDRLLQNGGLYAELWARQSGSFLVCGGRACIVVASAENILSNLTRL